MVHKKYILFLFLNLCDGPLSNITLSPADIFNYSNEYIEKKTWLQTVAKQITSSTTWSYLITMHSNFFQSLIKKKNQLCWPVHIRIQNISEDFCYYFGMFSRWIAIILGLGIMSPSLYSTILLLIKTLEQLH